MSGDPSDQSPEANEASVLATQVLKAKPSPGTEAVTSKMPSVASSAIEAIEVHDTSPGTNEPSAMARLRVQGGTELARGGMGSVHRVQDPGIGRWVALKRVDAEQARKMPEVAHLLLEEAQITGQLEHPNIVPIYDLGNDEHGNPMFTMKLVQGQTLTALIGLSERRGHGPHQLRAILDALVKACDAVAYAHDKGVIHRDLKPDNIMVGSYGQVYVVDWGCALVKSDPPGRAPNEEHVRVHSAGTARTSPEAVLGTVAYMAPEQARGHLGLIDERSDVYSLGAILYQVLTRRPPHRGKDAAHSMQMAQAGEVMPPTELRPHFDIPAQLAGIAMKALSALPHDRYQTVLELRDALKDFLAGGSWLPSRRFLKDDIIIAEGEPGDAAYIIVSGTCQASRSIQGVTTVIRRMGPGEVFGETAILTDQPRSATVTALTDMIVTVITREAVEGELMGASWVGAFARALAARFREAERRADAAHDLAGRVLDAIRVHLLAGQLLEAPWLPLRTAIAAAFGVAEHLVDDAVAGATEIVIDEATGVIRLVAT